MSRIDRGVMKLMGAGLLAVAAAGCSNGEASESEAATPELRLVSVQVTEVQPESFTDFVQVVATVEPNRDVTVSAEEAGTIREILVEKGSTVRAGQPIARIDDRVLRPQAEQAAAEAGLARETWERQQRLWEQDRVGSEIAYLQARYRAETTAAGARALRERLERTVIRSPIAGVLDDRLVEVGTLVSPGTPVARIIDTGRVKITGGVPERFAGQIQRGTEVEISIDGVSGSTFRETVDFVGASVNTQSRTFPIEIDIENPGAALKPGMIANVRVARATVNEALVVPQEAVLRVEDGYIVYVASPRGDELIAEVRPVVLGSAQRNRVIVEAGLQAGERVIVVGQNQVARGDRLEVVGAVSGGAR
ncbi:MAG TPA: efflux RND transporter periplasmic adaptor subunit [Longimicrobiaceae bacterium]|nr:efflux RND transporter periplasmic adaptor subunit [Longimicrobiaceae bacterium]